MRRSVWISIFGAFAAQTVLVSQAEAGPNDAVLIGVIKDASSGQGVEGRGRRHYRREAAG